jgi:predicted GNAT superfamily acetyltransferase
MPSLQWKSHIFSTKLKRVINLLNKLTRLQSQSFKDISIICISTGFFQRQTSLYLYSHLPTCLISGGKVKPLKNSQHFTADVLK